MHRFVSTFMCVASAALLLSGCSLYFGPESESGLPISGDGSGQGDDITPAQGVIQDCDTQGGYEVSSFRTDSQSSPTLWLGAVYQTRSDHSAGNHPMGEASVQFAVPGSNVLVLSAYEPTTWNVSVAAGAGLDRVVAIGYHEQIVSAPPGVAVELHDYEVQQSELVACGYVYPYDGQGCDTDELIANAERATGLPLHGFDGCYDATSFIYLPE